MRIAIFGQAPFGRDVLTGLVEAGHEIVTAYVPPDSGRPDPLAEAAASHGIPLRRHRRFRKRGQAIPELLKEHADLGAELNVLAYVTVILPLEILDAPPKGSLCFHPSLLPRFRGGAAIPWQIILGERESGVTVFQPDAGVDTGPIVVQKGGVEIASDDTAASLYYDKLYPLGVEAMLEAVAAIAGGTADPRPQDESRASHQGLVDDQVARVAWTQSAEVLDRLIRGCDPQPGAHTRHRDRSLRLYASASSSAAGGVAPGTVTAVADGRVHVACGEGCVSVERIRVEGGPKQAAAEAGLAPGDRLG